VRPTTRGKGRVAGLTGGGRRGPRASPAEVRGGPRASLAEGGEGGVASPVERGEGGPASPAERTSGARETRGTGGRSNSSEYGGVWLGIEDEGERVRRIPVGIGGDF